MYVCIYIYIYTHPHTQVCSCFQARDNYVRVISMHAAHSRASRAHTCARESARACAHLRVCVAKRNGRCS